MKFLLDTNAAIAVLARNQGLILTMRRHRPDDFGISAIAAHELFYGAYRSQKRAANLDLLDNLPISVVELDREDAREAGEIRAALANSGAPIGPYDVLIAGQARARGMTLITRNLDEFSRVQGLRVENWQT